jgi:hypothetical protein
LINTTFGKINQLKNLLKSMDLLGPSSTSSAKNESITHQFDTKRSVLSPNTKSFSQIYSLWILFFGLLLISLVIFTNKQANYLQGPIILEEVFSIPGFYPPHVPDEAYLDCPAAYSVPRNTEPVCRWKFDHYESSFYEKMWYDNIDEWAIDICGRIATDDHMRASKEIVTQVQKLVRAYPNATWSTVDSMPAGNLEEDYELMSRYHYTRECFDPVPREWKPAGKGVQLIEPLWAFLRDPFDRYCNLTYGKLPNWDGDITQSKEHIMPLGFAPYAYTLEDGDIPDDQWRTHGIPPWKRSAAVGEAPLPNSPYGAPRRIAIDMGSSYFGYWIRPDWDTAASGKWLWKTYHKRGIKFDKFLQVEQMSIINPTEQYSQIPEDLMPVYSFLHSGVSINPKSATHIAKIIRSFVRPQDFLALKVDIDRGDIEDPFSFSMLVDDSISGLVDEFFFEHHVDCDVMRAWGFDLPQNMTDSYVLFTGLRKKGMRTHSWP